MQGRLEPSGVLKALAVETRVKILDLLKTRGPQGSKGIAQALRITPAAASQHLKVLKRAGLLKSERKGYWIPYSIDEEAMERCRCLLDELCTCQCRHRTQMALEEGREVSLQRLREYQRELERELRIIRQRIEEKEREEKEEGKARKEAD
jgi:DNA-binding transcriptional ArsR family regulator